MSPCGGLAVAKKGELSGRQRLFVQALDSSGNATEAYIKAGYQARGASARANASRLLTHANVRAALAALRAARAGKADVDAVYVLRRLKDNVERAMQAVPVYDDAGNPTGAYSYDGAVANGALRLLGLHLGMFAGRHEHTGANARPVRAEVLHDDESLRKPPADELVRIRRRTLGLPPAGNGERGKRGGR